MVRADPITYAQTVADLYATLGSTHSLDDETSQLLQRSAPQPHATPDHYLRCGLRPNLT